MQIVAEIEPNFLTGEFDYFNTTLVKTILRFKKYGLFYWNISGIIIVVMFVMSALCLFSVF